MPRHPQYLLTIAIAAATAIAAAPVFGQGKPKYPEKPIRIVASTTAGSQPDGIARLIGQKMSEHWNEAVVVENRPGGGGTIAANVVAHATSDGHTIFYALPNFLTAVVLQPKLPYDPVKDFAAVSQIGMSTNVLVASPALGVKSIDDLVGLAKSQPGKLIFASSATGSASHLTGARFNLLAGIKIIHVAFKGGPDATIEVLAGRAQYHLGTMGVILPFVKDGKLTALAVTTPQRAPVLPDVPSLGEWNHEFARPETSHGIYVPAGTPRAIVNQISREIARILDLPEVKVRLAAIAFVASPSTPEEQGRIMRAQVESLGKLVRDAGLKPR